MDEPVANQVNRQTLLCLLIAQAVVIAPLFLYLPLWLGVVWVLSVIVRVQVHRGVWRFPSNTVKTAAALVAIGGLAWQYGMNVGVEPMVGLLLCAFMLKLLEARRRRDLLLIIFIGFIAVGAQFLFSQTIPATLYGIVSAIALLVAWQACYTSRKLSPWHHLRRSALLLAQAVPLMVLLFVLVPRMPPLWAVPTIEGAGSTGFSDEMAPGDIADLSLSSEPAFRVTFEGDEPLKSQMYWRGLVVDHFDGRRWTSSENRGAPELAYQGESPDGFWQLDGGGQTLSYRVMLEPHRQRWLFFLETPTDVRAGFETAFTANYLLKARWPVDSRVEYRVTSDLAATRGAIEVSPEMRERNLQLPPVPANPRARELADSWSDLSAREKVNRGLELFARDFVYTLQPPPLGTNSIDEFLFITRRGFCEHFAGSFVFLMRSAGVPARVVLGYQGGERSEVGDYWLVRQSASHAWAEVWLPGRGWTSVDPTAVVSPERIESGLGAALGADERYLAGGQTLLGAQEWPWLRRLQHRWDAAGYAWHRAVLGYDDEAQSSLLKRLLGAADPWRIGLALVLGAAVLLGLYGAALWYSNWRRPVPVELRHLKRAEGRLRIPRAPGETPRDWAGRVAEQRPDQAAQVTDLVNQFEAVAYAGQRAALSKLQAATRAIKRKR